MTGQWSPAPPPRHICVCPDSKDSPYGPPEHLTRWRCDCGVLWQVVKPGTSEALAATHTSPDGSLRWQRVPGAMKLQTPRTTEPHVPKYLRWLTRLFPWL